mgnify:CR=1 FL=1
MTEPAQSTAATKDRVGGAKVIDASSTPVRVTLFEDRAEVLRTAEASVPAGLSWLRIGEIATMVDDPTVIGNVRGDGARVLASRVTRRVRQVPACPKEEVEGAEAGYRAAIARRIEPVAAQRAAWNDAYGRWRRLYPALKDATR